MNEQQMMEFPETFEKFAREYGFKDDKEVYTNGSDLIPLFRVKQWLEHDNKLRTIETDTAYECGKHTNKWIPVSERLPEDGQSVLFCDNANDIMVGYHVKGRPDTHFSQDGTYDDMKNVRAWMPLPKPYKSEGAEWVDDKCSVCGKGIEDLIDSREWYKNETPNYCPFCGERVVERSTMMQEVAVVCSSMERAKWLMNYAIDKAPKVFKRRGRDYLLTTNNVKYVFMSYQNCERQLKGFRGLQLGDNEFEKMFACGFTEVKGE